MNSRHRPGTAPIPPGIAGEIEREGGRVTFARFMELALTHPTEGYYSRAGGKAGTLLGHRGHFSTAPYLSPSFCRALTRLLTELVDASLADVAADRHAATMSMAPGHPLAVIELGGGEGDLAGAILRGWEETRPSFRGLVAYVMVEVGPALRARQREALAGHMHRGWEIRWAEDPAAAAIGTRPLVIFGNEFIDALPVNLVNVRGPRPLEAWVSFDRGERGRLCEEWGALSDETAAELELLFSRLPEERLRSASRDGILELRPGVAGLMRQMAGLMKKGCLLTVDYGAWFASPAAEDGSCPRDQQARPLYGRTLRGYFRHQLVENPYVRVGHQDLTADVDFRALDLHGCENGFETVLFTSVASLLRADGGEEKLRSLSVRAGASLEADREATVLEALLDEAGLGGAFKVMLQVRD